jgi:uncharacterized protein with NRDE domain
MCLIVFDWRPAAEHGPLFTLAANRDEYLRRAAAPLGWWTDAPDVLAGRDLVAGGTWLGVTRDGRFAALTNHRAPQDFRPDAPTRGALVSTYLTGARRAPLDYLHRIAESGARYNGFNLLIGDFGRRELGWYCNRSSAAPILLDAGAHAISNAVLDTPWPKLVRKRDALRRLLERDAAPPLSSLIELMRDPRIARDDELPSTGLTLERERALSAAFIETPDYGTRGTTALRVGARDARLDVEIAELSDDDGSHQIARPGHHERHFTFDVVPSPSGGRESGGR